MADFQLDFSIGRDSFPPVHLSTTFIHISYSLWETAVSRPPQPVMFSVPERDLCPKCFCFFIVPPIGNLLTLQFYRPMAFAFPHPPKALLRFWGQERANLEICSWWNHDCSSEKTENNRLLLLFLCIKKVSILNVELVCWVFLEKDLAWGVACSSFGPEKLNLLQLWQQRCRKGVSEQKVCRQLPLHLTHTCTGRRTEDLTYWQASQSWHPSTLSITSKDTDGLKAVAKGILGQRVRVGVSERKAGGLCALH